MPPGDGQYSPGMITADHWPARVKFWFTQTQLRRARSFPHGAGSACASMALTPQTRQQILRVDGLCQDFELVTLRACLFQQVRGGRLAGKEQYLDAG
jgi:hypothetical protein